ncbi:MAG: TonB-dependent receptor, partial [Bacteroidia bacterium]|nr:TonB-dependent receptor [Bacteroidia bacterium]
MKVIISMRLLTPIIYFLVFISVTSYSQVTAVKGRVVDGYSSEEIQGAEVRLTSVNLFSETDVNGRFNISGDNLPLGEQLLVISANGYLSKKFRIIIEQGQEVNMDPILLETDLTISNAQIGLISLSDYELDQDEDTTPNFSGLLQATNDIFLNAAAYDFSATFFRPRGFDNSYSKLLINGIEMNKIIDGRPQWSNLGGLNDVQRNREFSMGSKPNDYSFGGIAGTTQMIMRASKYRSGGRVSYAMANRSYEGRVMGSYSSGHSRSGWSYTVLASRRYGERGYIEGTPYEANSIFFAVERKLNESHHINLAAFYTPVRRGRSTAITEEVENLKGRRYNPNWGYQDGQIRSSRIRRVEEPILMLNYFGDISDNQTININAAYQYGEIGNTRLDYGGNRNPAGNYYQRLPSFFLRNENHSTYDFQLAYDAREQFINNGQLDWESFYTANTDTSSGNSIYAIQEDIMKDNQLAINIISRTRISDQVTLNGKLEYRSLRSENFARLRDLLGGDGYLDIDNFGDNQSQIQNDLQNPDRVVLEGERYKYNYQLSASQLTGFIQTQFNFRNLEIYAAGRIADWQYQRNGQYQNGYFPEENRSLGKSEAIKFMELNAKAGATYTISGRHLVDINLAYISKPPGLRNSFANGRQNNDIIDGITTEKIQIADLSYLYRTSLIKARITAFYADLIDQTEIGYYFTQNALGSEDNNAFVQEIVTGINKRNIGVEFGLEWQ